MNNKIEVIGIDHGWSMMKTASQVFVTGIKEITTTPALFSDTLEYGGRYYNGYRVKVINLLEMERSDCYNPFSYIREETDVIKLITNLISNTTPKGSTPSDPFWEKAEGLFLQAIFYYVWLEEPPAKRNFTTALQLLGEAEVKEQGKPSRLDVRMKFLEESSKLGSNHPAVKQYNKCIHEKIAEKARNERLK